MSNPKDIKREHLGDEGKYMTKPGYTTDVNIFPSPSLRGGRLQRVTVYDVWEEPDLAGGVDVYCPLGFCAITSEGHGVGIRVLCDDHISQFDLWELLGTLRDMLIRPTELDDDGKPLPPLKSV